MIVWAFVLPVGLILGLLLAAATGGILYQNLAGAVKHENPLLPALHLFWIATIVGFIAFWVAYF